LQLSYWVEGEKSFGELSEKSSAFHFVSFRFHH
jgi:hypothetical protein